MLEVERLQNALLEEWYGLSQSGKAVVFLFVLAVLFTLTRNAESNALIAVSALTGLVIIAYFMIFFMAHF
jgi:uncharacterized membrane protein